MYGDGFDALIFDVDGTLADTERDGHRRAFNAAFAEAGLDWNWSVEFYRELLAVAGGKERILHFLRHRRSGFEPSTDMKDLVATLHRRKTDHYLDRLRSGAIPFRPGVLRLLRQARDAGIRLAIATTAAPESVTTLLECSGGPHLPGWFEVIAAGDAVANKKPAPDIYLLVLEELGLSAAHCVAVEDSDNGVRAALAANLRALLVTVNDYTRGQHFSGAALVLDGLGEPGSSPEVLAGELRSDEGLVDLGALNALHQSIYGGVET